MVLPPTSLRQRLDPARLASRSGVGAALLYLCLALPLVVFSAFVVAPGQFPDETNHFLRATQIAQGDLIGRRLSERKAGGTLPGAVLQALAPFDEMHLRADIKVDPAVTQRVRKIGWRDGGVVEADFANTVIYPPFFYLPGAAVVVAGRAAGLGVLSTFYLTRLANGFAALAASAVAIAFAVRGRAMLVALLLLPGTLGAYASCSQDALLVAATALAAGLCSRAARDPAALRDRWRVLATALVGAVVAARPPYLLLLGLLALRPLRLNRFAGWRSLAPVAVAGAIALAWFAGGAAPVKVPFRAASPAEQLSYLLDRPTALLAAGLQSFERGGHLYFQQFIGQLGWLDTVFPPGYYAWSACVLAAAALASALAPGAGLRTGERVLLAAAAGWTFLGLFAVQYMAWSPVRSDWIDGVQGRYFVPIALVLALALPSVAGEGRHRAMTLPSYLAWAVLLAFGVSNLVVVPWILAVRYYG